MTAEMTPESKFRGAGSAAARTAGSASSEIMGLYGHSGGSSCYVHTTRN